MTDSWFGGFMDGEGCIGIHRNGRNAPSLKIQVGNTNRAIVEEIHARYGGRMSEQKTPPGSRPLWRVTWCGVEARALLKRIAKRLIVKSEQARLGIAWHTQNADRETIRNQMLALNRKGTK